MMITLLIHPPQFLPFACWNAYKNQSVDHTASLDDQEVGSTPRRDISQRSVVWYISILYIISVAEDDDQNLLLIVKSLMFLTWYVAIRHLDRVHFVLAMFIKNAKCIKPWNKNIWTYDRPRVIRISDKCVSWRCVSPDYRNQCQSDQGEYTEHAS